MSTITIRDRSAVNMPIMYDSVFELYRYLVDHVIDLDVREHSLTEFSEDLQKKIATISERPNSSFINL